MNRNRTHPLRSSPLRMQRSRVDVLAKPPVIDVDFLSSNEYSNTEGSGIVRLSSYFFLAVNNFTSYSSNSAGPGFINSNGLVRMRTTGSAEPRFEFLSPTIGAPVRPLGLNIDINNYNYLENSRTMATGVGTYPWVATNITGAGTLNATGPDGTTSAITLTATVSDRTITQARGTTGIGAGTKMFSVWLKRKTGSSPIRIKLAGTTYTVVSVTGEWQRFSITGTGTAPSPGIQIANASDEIYVYCPQLSQALNQVFTPPNELIGDSQPVASEPDQMTLPLGSSNVGFSPITGETGTYFIEIDMSDRGGASQYAQAALYVNNGIDDGWGINISRNPADPVADYVTMNLQDPGGEWYLEALQYGALNSILRIAFSWDTRTATGTVSSAMWNDTTYPFGIPTLNVSSTQITSLNFGDPQFGLNFGRIFYVRKFKVWNEYKSPQELQMIVANG